MSRLSSISRRNTFLLLFKEIQPARFHRPISLFFSLLFVVPGIR
jgi:hypothetical protein